MERRGLCGSCDDGKGILQLSSKMRKKDDALGAKSMLLQPHSNLLTPSSFHSDGQLGFSPLTKQEGFNLLNGHDCFSKITGNGARGPFTSSQLLELEHQALIFKYIIAGIPVPPNLVLPLRRTFNPTISPFSTCSLRTNPLRWGSFRMGFSGGNLDPEPGRCRRTDGKKWRCGRDAVPDHKYCERHLMRSRQRSRKPVEGQTGQISTATASGTKPAATKVATADPQDGGGSAAESLANAQPQSKTLHLSVGRSSAANLNDGFLINKSNLDDPMHLSSAEANAAESTAAQKHQLPCYGFDLVSSYAQRNPSLQAKKYGLSSDVCTGGPEKTISLDHFIDRRPNAESLRQERTPFSISLDPISTMANFSSSFMSTAHEKLAFPQLTLLQETSPAPLGLGPAGTGARGDPFRRQSNWKTSIGGPLAEMLNSTGTATAGTGNDERDGCPVLNLMTHGWDASSPLGSSPTGVLQRNAFGSMSSSSTGSSPRAQMSKTPSALLL